ncbi:glutamyl-tRNA amidotransferase [miscellaneous Crenarchaeota group archaeon SMTZ-80]|nr:MAG: glutamyl-tRNA amidotransferase [miscellaneous Crenarchaeota group archaeon SMTZ-80]
MGNIKIGLEVHSQLTNLNSKLFCSCPTDYRGKEANSYICTICMGIPGTLPVLNKKAVEDAILIALSLNSKISDKMYFFRKNYFYPDMPKNFQISQYDKAGGITLATGGYVSIPNKKVRIRRIQIEEDPARINYEGTIYESKSSLVDYNRAGIALLEIVTEPDMESPKEARIFLQKLSSILEHLDVCHSYLEGSMRCDANISMEGGKRVEIKNISSFKEVERALNFEMTRQRNLLIKGISTKMETRHWDEIRRVTISLRVKEEEEEYRYFPEPDLVPTIITKEWVETIKDKMPELPDAHKERLIKKYELPPQNADVLVSYKFLGDFFEKCAELYYKPGTISNWLVGDLLGYLHEKGIQLQEMKISPLHISKMLKMVDNGIISGKIAKTVLEEMIIGGKMPEIIVKEKGLIRIHSDELIEQLANKVFKENKEAVNDALEDEKAMHFLIGQVMKLTKGRADPELTTKAVRDKLIGHKKLLEKKN